MSKFKVGDLALVVSSAYPENNGAAVELVSLLMPGKIIRSVLDGHEYKNNTGKALWYVVGNVLNRDLDTSGESFFAEDQLIPLRGDFQPEQQKSREVPA